MLQTQEVSRPLELEKAFNVRDLGVYTNIRGKKLMERQILRGDGLHSLSLEDQAYLMNYGVEAVIDLRSKVEIKDKPCVWRDGDEIDYYSIPLLDEIQSNNMAGKFPESMSALYISLLENRKEELAEVLRIIGKYSHEGVVFNCTAGKDRTGVVAMLLLGLVEADEDTIIMDYAVSGKNIEPLFREQKLQMERMGFEMPSFVLESHPKEMEETLEYIRSNYGGVKEYVADMGLTEEEVQSIKNKLEGV